MTCLALFQSAFIMRIIHFCGHRTYSLIWTALSPNPWSRNSPCSLTASRRHATMAGSFDYGIQLWRPLKQ